MIQFISSLVMASVALSLTNAADYVYTIPTVTNLLHGRGMGPVRSPGYLTARAEDNAFIREAIAERSGALEMSDDEIYPYPNPSGYSPSAYIWSLTDDDYRRLFPLSFDDVRSRINADFSLGEGICGYVKEKTNYTYNYLPLGEITESDFAVDGKRGVFYAIGDILAWPTNDFRKLQMIPGEPITAYCITNAYRVISKTKAMAYKTGFAGRRDISASRGANLLSVVSYTNDVETVLPLKVNVIDRHLTPSYSVHPDTFAEYTFKHDNDVITNTTCTHVSIQSETPTNTSRSLDAPWDFYLSYTRQKTRNLHFGCKAESTTIEDLYRLKKTQLAETVEETDSGYYIGIEQYYDLYSYIPVSVNDEKYGAPSEYDACLGVFLTRSKNLTRTVRDGAEIHTDDVMSTNEHAVAYFPVTLERTNHGPDTTNGKPGYHLYHVSRMSASYITRVILQRLGNYNQIQMPSFVHGFKTEEIVPYSDGSFNGYELNFETLTLFLDTSVRLELYLIFDKSHHATFSEGPTP